MKKYIDEEGNIIEEGEGYLFINGECVAEPLTDIEKYSIELQNNEGYLINGKFIKYKEN